jgi:hypothetical protein
MDAIPCVSLSGDVHLSDSRARPSGFKMLYAGPFGTSRALNVLGSGRVECNLIKPLPRVADRVHGTAEGQRPVIAGEFTA